MTTFDSREDNFDRFPSGIEEEAAETFVQRQHGAWTAQDQMALEARLNSDPAYADAYRRVEQSHVALGTHAETARLITYREQALACVRRERGRQWLKGSFQTRTRGRLVASWVIGTIAVAAAWQFSPYGFRPGEYRTDIGEQRIVDLGDHSRIVLDAATRLKVRYSKDARLVELREGQAQFTVAKDLNRPFKVIAGQRTIVALGTVFTVEYVGRQVHVAMMEGKVAVLPPPVVESRAHISQSVATRPVRPSRGNRNDAADGIELSTGQEIRIGPDGQISVNPKADLQAATAWREGKVIFRTESLGEAVQRLNRYSRLQIEIEDESLAARRIIGVFDAGDTQGFVTAVQRYYPVAADYTDSDRVRLRPAR